MALLHSQWYRQGRGQLAGGVLLLLSVIIACPGLLPYEHDDLCVDRQHACHTHGCWAVVQDPPSLVVTMGAWFWQRQQFLLPLEHPLGVFHPPPCSPSAVV